jgi:peptidoglycan lytic transglycosylase G
MSLFDRKPERRERTEDERERARAERKARRAGRTGETAAVYDPVTAPPEMNSPPRPDGNSAPAANEANVRTEYPAPQSFIDEPVTDGWAEVDEPAPAPRRARRSARRRPPAAGDAPPGRGRRRALAIVVLLLAVALVWFFVSLFQPLKGDGHGRVAVTIPKGVGVDKIGDTLADRGVVSSGFFFALRAHIAGRGSDLKPGSYNLRRDMSYGAAIDTLAKGPPRAKVIDLTIPEGRSIREETARLKQAAIPLQGDYAAAARHSAVLDPRAYGAPRGTRTLEGFLFPATYQVREGSTMQSLIDKQVTAFKRRFAGVDLRYAKRKNLSAYDILTIASMVEREAAVQRERPLVAAVIYNRLKQGSPLGIDATTRYEKNNWERPLSDADFDGSPYDTRHHKDLTPTPIGSPGLASIQAAAHPAAVRYLYYVVKPGACNEHAFSSKYDQFLKDQQRYDRARAKRGNRSPTTC